MQRLSDAHHFRKMVAGACMIIAPLLLLVGAVVHPEADTDEAAQLANVANSPDQWLIAHLILLASLVFLVPVLLGLMHMLREREVALGHVGGGLALIGTIATAGIVGMEFVVWQMGKAGDQAAMVSLLKAVNDSAGVILPFMVMSLALPLGLIVLATGLYRARAAQSWMAASIAVGALLFGIGFALTSLTLVIIAAAFLVVGLGSLGRMVYMESDADWEHTPEHPGFRPLPGVR
jgi:hypothetical protein